MDSHMTCEVYGNVGHSGNDCPETHEEAAFINNGFRQPLGNNGWNNQSRPQGNSNFNSNYNLNQPSFKDLVLGQAKINENITKKLMYNDKMLENINSQIESLSSAMQNQLSFNKMIETKNLQIAAAIPDDLILGKPPGNPRIPSKICRSMNEERSCVTDQKCQTLAKGKSVVIFKFKIFKTNISKI